MADRYNHWPCPYCFEDQRTATQLQNHLNLENLDSRRHGYRKSHNRHDRTPCHGFIKKVKEGSPKNTLACPGADCLQFYSQKSGLLRHYHSHVLCHTFCVCGTTLEDLRSLELHITTCELMKIRNENDLTGQKSQLLVLKERLCKKAAFELNKHLEQVNGTKRNGLGSQPQKRKESDSSVNVPGKSPKLYDATDVEGSATRESAPVSNELDWNSLGCEGFMFAPDIWNDIYFDIDSLLNNIE